MHVMVLTYGEAKKGYLNFTLGNLWATQPIVLLNLATLGLSVCSFNQTRKTFLKGFDLTEADREGECACLSVRVSVLTNILIQV